MTASQPPEPDLPAPAAAPAAAPAEAPGSPAVPAEAHATAQHSAQLPVQGGPYAAQIAALQQPRAGTGPIGRIRGTGLCILLTFVTLGIYPLVWYYQVHDEMKRHTGDGLGGGLALLIAFVVGVVSPFLASAEVGAMYARRGEAKPVSGQTGLWYIPGFLILVGPFVWFVKTNGALNDYWRSLGAS